MLLNLWAEDRLIIVEYPVHRSVSILSEDTEPRLCYCVYSLRIIVIIYWHKFTSACSTASICIGHTVLISRLIKAVRCSQSDSQRSNTWTYRRITRQEASTHHHQLTLHWHRTASRWSWQDPASVGNTALKYRDDIKSACLERRVPHRGEGYPIPK